jgi:hypothetical protein
MLTAEDHLALIALYGRYNRTIDSGDVEGWIATWAPDGAFRHPARPYRGTAELTEFVRARSAALPAHAVATQRHWNAEIAVAADGADGATGSCLLLVAGEERASGRPVIAARGSYRDALVRTPAGWRFAERALELE